MVECDNGPLNLEKWAGKMRPKLPEGLPSPYAGSGDQFIHVPKQTLRGPVEETLLIFASLPVQLVFLIADGLFGAVTSSSGTHQGPFGYGGPYGYQTDPDTGLMLLGHRFYDPSVGRFLNRDPIKDGRNWYGYGGGWANPVNSVDPDGLDVIWLYKNPGAGGEGSHLVIGVDDGRTIRYFGFYPGPREAGEEPGLRKGSGWVKQFDFPHPRAKRIGLDVEPGERKEVLKRILRSRLDYMRGKGQPGYNLAKYNCATWAANILTDYVPAIRNPSAVRTPAQLQKLIREDEREITR